MGRLRGSCSDERSRLGFAILPLPAVSSTPAPDRATIRIALGEVEFSERNTILGGEAFLIRFSLEYWIALLLLVLIFPAYPQVTEIYTSTRSLIGRVQADLKRAEDFVPPSQKERERYENAQRHLSELDRELSKGKFDKEKLDSAIDDVKNVVENNTLTPDSRDALTADLRSLRELRAKH